MADDVQTVEAKVIEPPEIVPSTMLDQQVAKAAEIADGWEGKYQPWTPRSADDRKQLWNERKALNAERKQVDAMQKEIFGPLDKAIKDGKAKFAGYRDRGKRLYQQMTDEIHAYDAQVVDYQLGQLEAYYEELAPAMAEQVPFGRIDAKWGEADGWHKHTANLVRMQEQLQGHCQEVSDTEQRIVALTQGMPKEDADRWRAEYFRTLDFQEAARIAQDAREQRERLRALDAEREAREAYERDQAAQAEPYVPGESYVPTEAESAPETPQEPKAGQVPTEVERAPQTGDRRPSEASGYVYMLVAFPREQMGFAVAALRSIQGSHGKMTKAEEWWNK